MKKLFKALADFQQEVPVIHKGTKGYGYSYSDLPTIFEVINPLLKKHGLGFTQLVGQGTINTMIFHVKTGETLETETAIPQNVTLKGMNDFQVLGSAITYIRRYALSSALGLVTDKDTDAGGQQVSVTKDMLEKLYKTKADKVPAEHADHIERIIQDDEKKSYQKTYNYLNKL
jgi:hypothetical protein